ncbi:MAG TPA: hypothetical protein EYN70_06860 [Planctomycetaceae bacterium]|nr:hypothetical protein [Planctomycetaceae bacterium]
MRPVMTSSSQPRTNPADVRMRGFTSRTPVADVIHWLDENVARAGSESVTLSAAAGRVIAEPISSPVDVPGFTRGMMDGFAVQAADTTGATSYNPLPLLVIGESLPGEPFEGDVEKGQAVRIMTGAPLPAGSDAVLPVELTQQREQDVLVIDHM